MIDNITDNIVNNMDSTVKDDIIWANPKMIKLINGADVKDFQFWSFLKSGAKTVPQIKKTEYYKWYLNHIKIGTHSDRINGIKNEQDIVNRLKYLLKLNDIVKKDTWFQDMDKPQVFIDSQGQIRIFEGCHRITCALYNNLQNIPLIVIHRHSDWIAFKDSLQDEYGKKTLYNPIDHPDFSDWPVMREHRIKVIEQEINAHNFYQVTDSKSQEKPGYYYKWNTGHYFQWSHAERLKGLDLGSHIGYFCHYMERCGVQMTGIDHNRIYYEKALYLNQVYGMSSTFYLEEIHDFLKRTKNRYDFVIALSVFYYLFRTDKDKARGMLARISEITDMAFIDSDPQELPEAVFLQEIADNTDFEARVIYAGRDGRKIYKLTKLEITPDKKK